MFVVFVDHAGVILFFLFFFFGFCFLVGRKVGDGGRVRRPGEGAHRGFAPGHCRGFASFHS
jgi:hypothetical protein